MNGLTREKKGLVHYLATNPLNPRGATKDPAFTAAVAGSLLLMGSSFIAGKVLLQEGFPPLMLAGWRFLFAALTALLLMCGFSGASRNDFLPSRFGIREYGTLSVIGLLQTTAAMGLLYLAMRRVSATTAAVLMFTNPLWVVAESLFLREAAWRGRGLSLLLRITGVILAIKVGSGFSTSSARVGDLIGVAAACCWAAATLIHRHACLPMGTWVRHFWQMLLGALVLLVLAYLSGEQWPFRMSALQVGCFLWLAIPATTISFGLWLYAVDRDAQIHTSGLLFLVPLITALLSYLLLHVRLTGWQAVGGVLIGTAVWFDSRRTPAEFVPPP